MCKLCEELCHVSFVSLTSQLSPHVGQSKRMGHHTCSRRLYLNSQHRMGMCVPGGAKIDLHNLYSANTDLVSCTATASIGNHSSGI